MSFRRRCRYKGRFYQPLFVTAHSICIEGSIQVKRGHCLLLKTQGFNAFSMKENIHVLEQL